MVDEEMVFIIIVRRVVLFINSMESHRKEVLYIDIVVTLLSQQLIVFYSLKFSIEIVFNDTISLS